MRITFVGHQTWAIDTGPSLILVDPLLKTVFGAFGHGKNAIYPFRKVSIDKKIDAVFLSHEHADHFCIESLNTLSRETKIYTGRLMPDSIDHAIKLLGFELVKFDDKSTFNINGIDITCFHAHSSTPYWENRVYQFLFQSGGSTFYLPVDSAISEEFINYIGETSLFLDLVAISNNAQVTGIGTRAAFDNASQSDDIAAKKNGLYGLSVYASLLRDYLSDVECIGHISICGGGIIKGLSEVKNHPLINHNEIANGITLTNQYLTAPLPGFTYVLSEGEISLVENCEWIELLSSADVQGFLGAINCEKHFFPLSQCDTEMNNLLKLQLDEYVEDILTAFSSSSWGDSLLKNAIENKYAPIFRIEVIGKTNFIYQMNIASGEYLSAMMSPIQASSVHSCLKIHLSDIFELMNRNIEIWDLTGQHVEVSYPSNSINLIIPFLYGYLSEHFNQVAYREIVTKAVKGIVQ